MRFAVDSKHLRDVTNLSLKELEKVKQAANIKAFWKTGRRDE